MNRARSGWDAWPLWLRALIWGLMCGTSSTIAMVLGNHQLVPWYVNLSAVTLLVAGGCFLIGDPKPKTGENLHDD